VANGVSSGIGAVEGRSWHLADDTGRPCGSAGSLVRNRDCDGRIRRLISGPSCASCPPPQCPYKGEQWLGRELSANRGYTEVSVLLGGSAGAVGRHNKARKVRVAIGPGTVSTRLRAARASSGCTTMAVPHFINDDRSEMRGIKSGWYAVEDDGNLSSGPFSSREQCLLRVTQPTSDPLPSVSLSRPK
jgi:hypothetical protein